MGDLKGSVKVSYAVRRPGNSVRHEWTVPSIMLSNELGARAKHTPIIRSKIVGRHMLNLNKRHYEISKQIFPNGQTLSYNFKHVPAAQINRLTK